jgi:hypothetical protein
MVVNFAWDMKSSPTTEAYIIEVVIITVQPGENVGSKIVAQQQAIFLHFLKQLQFAHLEC